MQLTTTRSRSVTATLWSVAVVAVLYALTGRLGFSLAIPPGNVTAVWPPSGIALAAALLLGRRAGIGIWLGSFAVNLWFLVDLTGRLSPEAAGAAAGIAVGSSLQALMGAWLILRVLGREGVLSGPRHLLVFAGLVLISCLYASTTGVVSLVLGGFVPWSDFGDTWWTWWLGDGVGVLVLTPAILTWRRAPPLPAQPELRAEALILVALAAGLGYAVFIEEGGAGLAFALLPVVAWAAARFAWYGATGATVVVSTFAVLGTAQGRGPFVSDTQDEAGLLLALFIALTSLTGLVLAATRTSATVAAESADGERAGAAEESGDPSGVPSPAPVLSLRAVTAAIRWWPVVAVLTLGVTGSVLWFHEESSRNRAAREAEFDQAALRLQSELLREIAANVEVVDSVARMFDSSGFVEREEFATFVSPTLERRESIVALSWNPLVRPDEIPAYEKAATADGVADFVITEQTPEGERVPVGPRNAYVVVFYIEPLAANSAALGFDIASEPLRRVALERARDSGAPSATASIALVQDEQPYPAFLLFVPVYRHTEPADASDAVWGQLQGYAVGVFSVDRLMQTALEHAGVGGIGYALFDEPAGGEDPGDLIGGEEPPADPAYEGTVAVAGTSWRLVAFPSEGWQGGADAAALAFLIVGLAGTCAIAFAVTLVTAGRERAEALARTRSAALLDAAEDRATLRERARLAQELHDTVSQAFFTIGLHSVAPEDETNESLRARLAHMRALASRGGAATRQAIHSLADDAPPADLRTLVEQQCRTFRESSRLNVRTEVALDGRTIDPQSVVLLSSFVRETLNNIEKHAHATSVRVQVTRNARELLMIVTDDGIGRRAQVEDRLGAREGFGLRTLRQRAKGLGGDLRLVDLEPRGLAVECRLPLPDAA